MNAARFTTCRRRYLDSAARHTATDVQPTKGHLHARRQDAAQRRRALAGAVAYTAAGLLTLRCSLSDVKDTLDAILAAVDVANRILYDCDANINQEQRSRLSDCTSAIRPRRGKVATATP